MADEELTRWIHARTPARIFEGPPSVSYPTSVQLALRADHAAARDAVLAEWEMERDLGRACVERFALFTVQSQANSKSDFLLHPNRGRSLSTAAREEIVRRCPREVDLQVVIGDGLSVAAVRAQGPAILPALADAAARRGWKWGQPLAIRYCRVGIMNDVGALLAPRVVILLIGERPGLATAESLSAYMAFRPGPGHTDARRNLISNIHARGTRPAEAARRIAALAARMMTLEASGATLKEDLGPASLVEERGLIADLGDAG